MEDDNLILNSGGNEYLLTPENATLFTHIGDLAIYDHVFMELSRDEERAEGVYFFAHVLSFDSIKRHLIEHNFTQHLNLRSVAECDQEAFLGSVEKFQIDIPDTFPEDWK